MFCSNIYRKCTVYVGLLIALLLLVSGTALAAPPAQGGPEVAPSYIGPSNPVELQTLNNGVLYPDGTKERPDAKWYTLTIPDVGQGLVNITGYLEVLEGDDNFVDVYIYDTRNYPKHIAAGKKVDIWIIPGVEYWFQVYNAWDNRITYKLVLETPEHILHPEATAEPEVTPVPGLEAEVEPEATPMPEATELEAEAEVPDENLISNNPDKPVPFDMVDKTSAKVPAKSVAWYSAGFHDPQNSRKSQEFAITCFVTPVDGNEVRSVAVQLFEEGQKEHKVGPETQGMESFGVGKLDMGYNSRKESFGDRETAALISWRGSLIAGDRYLISLENKLGYPLDYTCFPYEIWNVLLGEQPVIMPEAFGPGLSPMTATPLNMNNPLAEKVGTLNHGEDSWHLIQIGNLDADFQEEVSLTMVYTPFDGNSQHYVTFKIYPLGGTKQWSKHDTADNRIFHMGAGSIVVRDNNPETGERFWTGWVNEGDIYVVQVSNDSGKPIDYHLFVGDLYGPSLGSGTVY